jgi:hypothetical protein
MPKAGMPDLFLEIMQRTGFAAVLILTGRFAGDGSDGVFGRPVMVPTVVAG